MSRTMYVNFEKDKPKQSGFGRVVPLDDGVFPVEMLFNENSSVGEVRPLSSGSVRLRMEDGSVMPFTMLKDENLVLAHEDLEDKGALIMKPPAADDRAWTMSDKDRSFYMDLVLTEGPFDEDDLAAFRARADRSGMESLTEAQQMLVDHGKDSDLFAVQDFMEQIGMMADGADPDNYSSYGSTDTGRYLQIELKDEPGVLRDVYEAPPSGDMRQFFDMRPGEGKMNFMSVKEGDYEVKGVYVGQPFQAERDQAQAIHDGISASMDGPEGPGTGSGPVPGSPFARMCAMTAAMDKEDDGPDCDGPGYDE